MSEIVQELREKARLWQTEAAISSEDWRPMYQMLAWEYDRFAQEREDHSEKIPEDGVTPKLPAILRPTGLVMAPWRCGSW
jgi:hypothetical protein